MYLVNPYSRVHYSLRTIISPSGCVQLTSITCSANSGHSLPGKTFITLKHSSDPSEQLWLLLATILSFWSWLSVLILIYFLWRSFSLPFSPQQFFLCCLFHRCSFLDFYLPMDLYMLCWKAATRFTLEAISILLDRIFPGALDWIVPRQHRFRILRGPIGE